MGVAKSLFPAPGGQAICRPIGSKPSPPAAPPPPAPPQAPRPAAAAGPGGGARRGRDTDHPGAAPDPLGDLRRPESGQPRVLPELGTGRHRVGLPAGGRGRLAAPTHLVDVGAGAVLPCLPGSGPRLHRAVAQTTRITTATGVHRGDQHPDDRLIRLRDHRSPIRPDSRLLQQFRPRLGTAARSAGGRFDSLHQLADVGADAAGQCRPVDDPVLRCPDRRRHTVPRTVGTGSGRCGGVTDPGRGQSLGTPVDAGPAAASQPPTGDRAPGDTGFDGVLAVSVALAAADLLARLHRRRACAVLRWPRHPADLCCSGLSDDALHRRATALPTHGPSPRHRHRPGEILAFPVAAAHHRRRHRCRPARGGADGHLLHLA